MPTAELKNPAVIHHGNLFFGAVAVLWAVDSSLYMETLWTPLPASYGLHGGYFESMRPLQIQVVSAWAVLHPSPVETGGQLQLQGRCQSERGGQPRVLPPATLVVLRLLLSVPWGQLWTVSGMGRPSPWWKRNKWGWRWERRQTSFCCIIISVECFLSYLPMRMNPLLASAELVFTAQCDSHWAWMHAWSQ